jgi:uncharacterized C2H2 Zn-finger protein
LEQTVLKFQGPSKRTEMRGASDDGEGEVKVEQIDGVKKYRCTECGKVYATLGTCSRHVRKIHDAPEMVKCSNVSCTQEFPNSSDMQRHAVKLHGEGSVFCPVGDCAHVNDDFIL